MTLPDLMSGAPAIPPPTGLPVSLIVLLIVAAVAGFLTVLAISAYADMQDRRREERNAFDGELE